MQDLMPPVDTPDKLFHDGDPTQGIEGTIVTAEWLNDSQGATRDAQQELKNVLAAASITPDETKQNQLVTAINALITSAITGAKYVPDVGELYISKTKTDPNVKWPGTTWTLISEGLALSSAKADLSNVGTTIGSNSVTLAITNIPGHTHSFSATSGAYDFAAATTSQQGAQNVTSGAYDFAAATTSSFDYGTKTSNSTGAHTHPVNTQGSSITGSATIIGADARSVTDRYSQVSAVSAGAHTHTVGIGAHTHTVDLGSHTHSVSVPAHSHTLDLPSHTHSVSGTTGSAGDGAAFSIQPKSLVVAVWERTA